MSTTSTKRPHTVDVKQLTITVRKGDPGSVTGLLVLHATERYRYFDFQAIIARCGRVMLLGRAEKSPILLDHATVSRTHATITCESGRYWLKSDAKAKGPTKAAGKLLEDEAVLLTTGMHVEFGEVHGVVVDEGPKTGDEIVISAATFEDFIATAVDAHGGNRQAGRALQIGEWMIRRVLQRRARKLCNPHGVPTACPDAIVEDDGSHSDGVPFDQLHAHR